MLFRSVQAGEMDKFIAHILVVDDDDGIRSLVKKYLNENKFLVTTAENAENALEKIKIIKFDLIILDIMMPIKSGLEFLKENKEKLETPVILLTAKGEANERVEGLEIENKTGQKFNIVEGIFPNSINNFVINKPISFAHIDVDTYVSAKQSLDFLLNNSINGALIILDDYGGWFTDGITKFIDDSFNELHDIKLDIVFSEQQSKKFY